MHCQVLIFELGPTLLRTMTHPLLLHLLAPFLLFDFAQLLLSVEIIVVLLQIDLSILVEVNFDLKFFNRLLQIWLHKLLCILHNHKEIVLYFRRLYQSFLVQVVVL